MVAIYIKIAIFLAVGKTEKQCFVIFYDFFVKEVK